MHKIEIDTYVDRKHELTIKVPDEFETGKIKVILVQTDNIKKKYVKQELFDGISYPGLPTDSQCVDEILYK